MRDETVSRQVCLADVVTGKEETVLRVLQRGVVHEVLRVCVSQRLILFARLAPVAPSETTKPGLKWSFLFSASGGGGVSY